MTINKVEVVVTDTNKEHLIGVLRHIADQLEKGINEDKLVYKDNDRIFQYGRYEYNLHSLDGYLQ
ncbi:MAG: hypothetical protein PHW29_04450 [Flavobacterium sp.]|nr:hypothetical protein [Flavobacterium sp.]